MCVGGWMDGWLPGAGACMQTECGERRGRLTVAAGGCSCGGGKGWSGDEERTVAREISRFVGEGELFVIHLHTRRQPSSLVCLPSLSFACAAGAERERWRSTVKLARNAERRRPAALSFRLSLQTPGRLYSVLLPCISCYAAIPE